jgi:sec-independent protein translocase protein TatB
MELLVIGIVALIVVGPKDLPVMFRKLGQFTGRVRAMAKDFQRAMDDAADEAGVKEINRDLRKATNFATNPRKAGMDALKQTLGDDFDLDPEAYEPGTATRELAEERAAAAQKRQEEIAALRQAKIDRAIADKQAAAAPPRPAPEAPPAPAAADPAPATDAPQTARPGSPQP